MFDNFFVAAMLRKIASSKPVRYLVPSFKNSCTEPTAAIAIRI